VRPAEPPARPAVQVNTALVTRVTSPVAAPAPASPPTPTPAVAPPAETAAAVAEAARLAVAPAPAPATPGPAAISAPAAPASPAQPAEKKPVLVSGTFPDLHLQAIFYRLKKPSVMINGRTYYTGEMIGDAQLTKIERDHVVVTRQGEARHLNLR